MYEIPEPVLRVTIEILNRLPYEQVAQLIPALQNLKKISEVSSEE